MDVHIQKIRALREYAFDYTVEQINDIRKYAEEMYK